jgi:transposase
MVWTPETRHRVGDVGCSGRLSDAEFARLSPMLPPAKPGGRPRTTELRGVLDGLFHILRTGRQWRHLPAAYPPWQTVYGYWRAFITIGVWDEMLHVLRMAAREARGRGASPSAAIIDSQSAKTREKGGRAAGCRQEGERTQAPDRGRYARFPDRRSGPPGRYSRSARRRFVAAPPPRCRLAPGDPLRRQRLCQADGRKRRAKCSAAATSLSSPKTPSRAAFMFCPSAGWSRAPWRGSVATAASPKTTNICPPSAKPSSNSRRSVS